MIDREALFNKRTERIYCANILSKTLQQEIKVRKLKKNMSKKERKTMTEPSEKNKTAADNITGNEAEAFIKKIAIKIVITTAILMVGVGIAVYYTSGHS